MTEFRISKEFSMDEGTFYACFDSFYCSHADLAAAWPGTTNVNAVAMKLAAEPWADPQESLRACEVACAVLGIHDRFDWLETERRATMRRNAAQAVDSIWRAALSGNLDRTMSKTPAA
jgi:hypothetical protein